MLLKKIIYSFFNSCFSDCLFCKENANQINRLCQECEKLLQPYIGCFRCPMNQPCSCFFSCFIPLSYNTIIRDLILKFKYNQKFYLADFFADVIIKNTTISNHCDRHTVFVPIPMTRSKLFARSYNQSLLLCKALAKCFNAEIGCFVFKKTKNSIQANKTSEERFHNVQSIQLQSISGIIGKNICIVDDVVASGNTIIRCAELLRPYAKHISIAAIAKS